MDKLYIISTTYKLSFLYNISFFFQMDTMGKNYMDKVDNRLVMQDKVLESIGESVKEIQSKSRVWDTFQHHVTSWSSIMTAVDAKADHLRVSFRKGTRKW